MTSITTDAAAAPSPALATRTRWFTWAAVFVLWAAIYLPGLGSVELKGEEARRVMPAVTVLEHGDWLVPHISGEAYYRKPPMIN